MCVIQMMVAVAITIIKNEGNCQKVITDPSHDTFCEQCDENCLIEGCISKTVEVSVFDGKELLDNNHNYKNGEKGKANKHPKNKAFIPLRASTRLGQMCEESGFEGILRLINSSAELKGMILTRHDCWSVVRGLRGSVVAVRGCGVEMGRGKEVGVFMLGGCRGVFWNITLRGVGRGGNVCGRLFGGEGRMGQTRSGREGGERGGGWGRGSGRDEGGERGGQRGGGGRRGGEGRGSEGRGEESEGGGSVLVSESDFPSFCVSSAPFLAPPLTPLVTLTRLTFFNISTNPLKTTHLTEGQIQTSFLMSGCTFLSVWDVYDGGIVPSLNSPSSSLAASNTSFVRCYRTQNVEYTGSEGNPSKPERQNQTDDGMNSFTWCVWNGSKTTGTRASYTDGVSSGGAIFMYNLGSGTLSVKFCSFNDCYAHYGGGGILCVSINSIKIENNSFNACTAKNNGGGGIYAYNIELCVRISGCEFQKCKANSFGGGLYLYTFNISGSACIGTESGKGESACVFECSFTSCSLTSQYGGGMYCVTVPAAFKMRSLQFISCSAVSYGGGLYLKPYQSIAPSNNLYCYFFFFHDCSCNASTSYGHDVYFYDNFNLFSSNNPFYESYTTNSNDMRVCYFYGSYQFSEKKDWLKEGMKDRYVGVGGDDASNLCGMSEPAPCKTMGHAVDVSVAQLGSIITVLDGKHVNEVESINVGGKKILIVGKGKEVSVIGTKSLSSSSTTLFSVTSGQLGVEHVGIDHNATRSSSPSVFVVSVGSGTLSLEDVAIDSSTSGGGGISSSVFEMVLRQMKMIDVEIKNMKMSQPLFSEPLSTGSASGESVLGNVTIRNVNRTEGDGVVMAKSVKGDETFVMWNTTIEVCECANGNGGGIFVWLQESGKFDVNGTSVIDGNKAENNGRSGGNGGRGGGMFVLMESGGCGLRIGQNVKFSKVKKNVATYGKDVFVDCGSGVFLESKVNTTSFAFFDTSTIPSDVFQLSGSENGEENGVIPLFVYLCTMGTKVLVDGSGGNGKDHSHCGFDAFKCLTVDYCTNSRMSSTVNEIEVVSSSSIAKEITGPSFGVSISGRIVSSSSAGERMGVNVSDGGSDTQDWLVGCSSSLTMRRLSFVVKGQLKARRSAFIHSTSTLSVTNCSVSFESGALTDGKIGYSIIEMTGGNLIVDGFVMESGMTLKMNGKSPITMTIGAQLEISNSRVSEVEVEMNAAGGNGGGGYLNVGMGVNGNVKIEESNISSTCSGGSGMKGGGMMMSIGSGGTLRVKGVKLSGCVVPSEDIENGGRGMGGGMFAELADATGTFSLESMTFSGCNAWKGKNLFVEAQDLSAVINSTSIGFNPEIGINVADLDELCGRERNQTDVIVPLVVFLRTFSSPAYVSGREQGSEFRLCGYEDYPCKGIGNVGEVQFPNVGLKVGGTGTKTQEALVLNSVSSTLTGILFELGGSIWERSSFVHSTSGTLRFADCGIKMGSGVDSANYVFVSGSGGTLFISGFSMTHVRFGMNPFIVVDGNGGASIEDSLLESVETTNMKGLIEYSSSSSSLTIGNVTAQECVMGGEGLTWDDNGKKLGMRNCTIMKTRSLEGNGSVVSGEVGDGCAVEVSDVVIEGCGTLKGCGGGMGVMLKGTGEMRLGKSGVVTLFEKCSAGGEGSVGGYGGGVLLRCEKGGSDFVMSGLTFGRGEGANTAAHGGNNVLVEGTSLPQLVNNVSFDFSFEIEGEGFNIKDLMGAENGNEMRLIPVVVFFREKPSVGYVNGGNGGMDYHKCGYADFPCSTLTYAGTNLFGTSPATLKLADGSFISDEMTLNTQEMNIDGDIEKAKIGISEGGENVFLIKSERAVSFSSLAFSISTFAESRKEYVFLCGANTLRFEGCSFGAESEEIGIGLICGKGGKVELVKCEFENIQMTKTGMVTFDGIGVGGLIDEVIVRNVTRENVGRSLFELRNGGDVEVKNTTMNKSSFENGNEIEIGEGINAKIWNCTFKSIQRVNGNGGVLNGKVGSGKCVDINKCVFEECRCNSVSTIGGGIVLIVGDGGKLLFDDNKMNGCTVSERTGKGGGLHLTFETTNAEYSMKNDTFTNNVAEKGEDVYLVCGSPWRMLLPALWEGTATRVTAENKMWVLESSEPRKEDSLINYLFPRLGTDLFVSNAGNGLSSCGAKENPCSSVDIGFDRLKDEIERIMLVGAASVSKTINRGGKGLTIKGNEETRELVVEEGGKFELTEGDGQTHLTLSLLQISLPCSSTASATGDESIMEARIGECFILDCLFSGEEGNSNVNECGKWIVIGNGGVIRIERTEMNGIRFEGCGIAQLGGGNVLFENCSLNGIETSGGGVIVGNGGSEVTLRNMTALGCVVGAGSLITSNGGSSLRVDEESRFENIDTESVSGGCLKSEMKLNDLLEMGSSSILKCSANGNGGRGGGIYLNLSDNCVNNFVLTTLTFEGNVATEGRDLFISCKKLNETVTKERFGFEYKYENGEREGEGQAVDMKGVDRDHFEESVDLGLFLVEMKGMEVCVSREGYDTLGCGSDGYPCESMWSGISHIDRSGTEGERKVKVRDEGTIEDIYSFTDALVIDGCVNEGDETKHKPIHFEGTIKGNSASSSSSVISSTASLSLLSLKLQIPSQFEPSMNTLISSSGILQLESCLFEIRSSTHTVQYSLITTTSGSCTLKGCSLTGPSFVKSPLVMASSVFIESNNFSNIVNTGSGEGGIAKVTLKGNEKLEIKSTNVSSCSLSSRNGKGGFLYLDCQNCLNEKPFLLESVTFENNTASNGKNMFILGKDFNSSVTNDSFNFDYSSMANDKTLFVGSDDFHEEKDLFMFLVSYSSFEIFISSEGYDVARCGSEEGPCFTMWKGMKNMRDGDALKTIQINGSTIIRDSFNMSNYQIKKGEKMGGEDTKAILNFEKAIGSQLECFMENDIHLELINIQLQLASGFDNSAKTIISNKGGDLVISECSFHSEAEVNNGFDCVFVDVIGGTVEVNDLSMESCNVGNSIFAIDNAGVSCHFVNVRVESLNESGGCLLLIKGTELTTKINEVGEEMSLNIDNSSFSGVKRSDNGASILESKSENKICLVVNSSNITEDKAELSEKGGAIFFTLGASGSMKMIDSTISQCSCSFSSGRGGGVYLATKEKGELDFTFMGMKFSDNRARVGNDIYIECFNITSQINESQFQFDLREGNFNRFDAIYGIDSCEHKEDANLIGFVTIHQSDTIIVSSAVGSNDRQCGTNTLPCDTIEHGLVHLTSEYVSQIFIVEESVIGREINLEEMSLSSKSRDFCEVEVKSRIEKTREALISTRETVSLMRVNFVFDSNFVSSHESLISPEGGILEVVNCSFDSKQSAGEGNIELAIIPFHIIQMTKGELQLDGCSISNLILHESALSLSSSLSSVIDSLTICNSTAKTSLIDIYECGKLTIKNFNTENITVEGNEETLISCLTMKKTMQLTNCTIGGVSSQTTKGKLMKLEDCLDVKIDNCVFDGSVKERNEKNLNVEEEMCRREGSLVDVVKSFVMMKDTTISNSPEGGISMSGGNVNIEMGLFENNNPSIEGYPSLRRNIICSDSGTLNVKKREVEGSATKYLISNCGDEIEVSVHVLFGNAESPSSTQPFILKNTSISPPNDNERISKGGNKNNNGNLNMFEWSLFAFIGFVVAFLIFVALFVVVVVLLRRKLREAEKKVERERLETEQIMGKIERRRRENNGRSFEMSEMPSTLLEGMTSQIPLLIDNDEDLPEPPPMSNEEILNENDLPDLEPPLAFSENASVPGMQQSHSFNVISAKKPFREKEKKNVKTLHSVIHSVQGNFTLGTRAMDVVDGKEVVLAVAELFEHLISVGDERVGMMGRQLCPYSIFVEEGNENEIYLLTEELEDEKEKDELKRWKAPEAGDEEEGIEKAAVFSLGLILHEMTTGEVPLSECDAEEAQEMMRDGVRPLTEGIEGEDMVELMEKMWADEPDYRPNLAQVIRFLKVLD
ncbi:uncharacterized protein MONOS_3938 [Monocercomonoides exilis]|uniref:uncharacterized protein n=1 Tax=Monocercomonoides exilis TaxID=2049356 RepID=UPI0035598398|nr:hypothetical protein MONOS_3938 [Monocercomonoides exilis]|eukprot:MONOS_3938.1-p1 / transcript=MONOS_3938.1 / gene=MONOS_3938 / organism=Monocercomonoides_exilis_PA203 / gene_product=unspecified product / transcript_product=unspecified product / location=Mono_scaffold00098:41283-53849(+) / protein_length=3954 / sequence_SO=supercontig / SO=protein_coding / is_pseudo=false